ncbi:MAG: helix-turn-helix domain-containing protein [Bacteroidia bacterium]|nr:helix-turn-helix domain-containing protein [Bacteroidia bacterium]
MRNLIYSFAAASMFLLGFLVLTVSNRPNRLASRWLGIFLCATALVLLDDTLLVYGIYQRWPHLLGWNDLFLLVMAPALFLSIRHFTRLETQPIPAQAIHFVPAGLFALTSLPTLLLPGEQKARLLAQSISTGPDLQDWIIISLIWLQAGAYLAVSLYSLHRHERRLPLITASPEPSALDWLRHFLYVICGFWMVWILSYYLPILNWADPVLYLLGTYYLGYFAMKQTEVFPFSPAQKTALAGLDTPIPATEPPATPASPTLAQDRLHLLAVMETRQPYLQQDLSLPALAEAAGLTPHALSYLLNTGFGENFYQFVNRYRVAESQRLLTDPSLAHLSMVGIAYEAGFNSKTAFNTAFKKITGLSPSAWRQSRP